jgi:DNA-binding PadR family transcriptional regulator
MARDYPLRPFQYFFLCAVDELGTKAYGLEILRWLRQRLNHPINPGQVYMAGARLAKRKLVTCHTESIEIGGRSRPVILYTLTDPGKDELSAAAAYNNNPRAA